MKGVDVMESRVVLALKATLAAIVAALTWLFGGWDMLLTVVLVMVVADYATGLIAAIITKSVNSEVGWRGILKKVLILGVVVIAAQLDKVVGGGDTVRSVACIFYIGNEGISITENLGRAGVPLPGKLKEIFAQLKSWDEPPDAA